ncbi:MAG: CHASE2 domain-containing protein [Hyphomicrobiaceae bacterium]
MPKSTRSITLAGLATIVVFAVLRLWDPAPLAALRSFVFDLYQTASPRSDDARAVLIVDIDDRSLAEVGQWPWSRAVVAELVDRLSAAGAVAIGFDMIFAEPDRLSPRRITRSLGTTSDRLEAALADLPDTDARLAHSLSNARVVLGQSGTTGTGTEPAAADIPAASIATIGGDPRADLMRFQRLLTNMPELEKAASGRGLFSVRPERDGVIRRIPLIAAAGDRVVPALSVEVIRVAAGAKTTLVKRDAAGIRSVVVAGVEIPTDRDGQLWLHFGTHDRTRYISAVDVLRDPAGAQRIAGKIALVGTSAVGLFDLRTTPVERVVPGVEIHAQAIESILAGSTLERPNYATGAELVLAIVAGLAIMLAIPRLGAHATFLVGGALSALLAGASWYLFASQAVLLDVTYPLLSSGCLFLLLTFGNYVREERQRTQIRNAFSQYLSADLVERLVREPDRLTLGGETREMTILFTDFRGFTAIAETYKSNPAGLTALMNRLLTPLSLAVIEQRGTIDKYIGDAIMAFWNAPLDDPEHARHACAAALDILQRLDALNAARLEESRHAPDQVAIPEIGIGIATGLNVVGNMGSDLRFDYTVMGDSVNVASRLEGLTRQFGLRILLASETAAACAGHFAMLEVDRVHLKGKADPETVFTLIGDADVARSAAFRALSAAFAQVLECYRRGALPDARQALDACRAITGLEAAAPLLDLYAHKLDEQAARTTPGPLSAAPKLP